MFAIDITIDELMKGFKVKSWTHVTYDENGERESTGKEQIYGEYTFVAGENGTLFVTGDVFGDTKYMVLNALEVCYKVSKQYIFINVKLDGLHFELYNITLDLE